MFTHLTQPKPDLCAFDESPARGKTLKCPLILNMATDRDRERASASEALRGGKIKREFRPSSLLSVYLSGDLEKFEQNNE